MSLYRRRACSVLRLFSTYSFGHRCGDGLGWVSGNQAPPAIVGWLFIILGGGFFLAGQSLAICIIIAGRFLAQRRRYLFVFVIGGCECLFMPSGTVLGVFTIVLLSRESVKAAFDGERSIPSEAHPISS